MTQAIEIESRVGKDGVLTLCVPLSPADADTEVVVTIRPKGSGAGGAAPAEAEWPAGYFDRTYGSLAGDPLEIPEDPVPAPEALE